MKNVLLSIALLVLIVLLLLPFGLKLFGKNLYTEKKDSPKEDKIQTLSCTKINETISTTFLNDKAFNIRYRISGNHVPEEIKKEETTETENLPDEIESEKEEVKENIFIDDFSEYATITYREEENLTQFSISLDAFDVIPEKLENHAKTINEVEAYYKDLSFSCNISN